MSAVPPPSYFAGFEVIDQLGNSGSRSTFRVRPDSPAFAMMILTADDECASRNFRRTGLVSGLTAGLIVDMTTEASLAARSGGNIFNLLQYLDAVIDAGLWQPDWGHWRLDTEAAKKRRSPSGRCCGRRG